MKVKFSNIIDKNISEIILIMKFIFLKMKVTLIGRIKRLLNKKKIHIYMAQLKDNINESKVIINNSVSYYIYPKQKFLYEGINQQAWLSDGRYGYLATEKVSKLQKEKIYKFKFSPHSFIQNDNDEIVRFTQNINIDFKYLVDSAANHNEISMKLLIETRHLLTEELQTVHDTLFWKIINNWSDFLLSRFLNKNSVVFKFEFADFLINKVKSDPIIDKNSYIKTYYPLTFKIIKKCF